MNVTVRYHGIIGDMLRRKTQQVAMPDGATVSDLLATITDGDEGAQMILKQTRAFIDGQQTDRATLSPTTPKSPSCGLLQEE